MVSYKKQFNTGTRTIREEPVKSYKSRISDTSTNTSPSPTSDRPSDSVSSMNYLFNNKMNQSKQMMGNSMMNQMPQMPQMNQFNPMGNQFNPMSQMNQFDPMMNQMSQMNQFDPMMNQMSQMNQFDPMMNQMNPMMMGNTPGDPSGMNYDALSIQTMAPVNRQHNGSTNNINNLALLNNNNNMNNANYTEMSDIREVAKPYAGMNHAGMNHAGMNHSGMNHSGMNHVGITRANLNEPGNPTAPDSEVAIPDPTTVASNLNNLAKL